MIKNKILKSFVVWVLASLITAIFYELIVGAHAECGYNDSVGPCEFSGRLAMSFPGLLVLTLIFWVAYVLAIITGNRKNNDTKMPHNLKKR